MRETLRSVLIACLAMLSLAGTVARADQYSQYDLSQNWLDGGSTLDAAHLQRLIDIAQNDPETASVVATAENVIGAGTADQLLDFVKICQNADTSSLSAVSGTPVVGLANVQAFRHITGKSVAELLGQDAPDHNAALAAVLQPKETIVKTTDSPDYVTGDSILRGSICIDRNADMRLAFETFIHEMTHLGQMMPQVEDETFLMNYPTIDEYVNEKLVQQGGEFDANYNGYRAAIRLGHTRAGLPQGVQDSFDDEGNLVDRQKFINFLLYDAGYNGLLRQNYRSEISALYNGLIDRQNFLVQMYNDRVKQTSPIYSDDVRQAASQSEQRLGDELTHVRQLIEQYHNRIIAEGDASFGSGGLASLGVKN